MTHQPLSISLKEGETPVPDWRHFANEKRDRALSLKQRYENYYANCLVHVARQRAVWFISKLIKDLKWTRGTISVLPSEEWAGVLEVPSEWEDEEGETSGAYLVGLLSFFSFYIIRLQTFLRETCPSNPISSLFCPRAICQKHCCPLVPTHMLYVEG